MDLWPNIFDTFGKSIVLTNWQTLADIKESSMSINPDYEFIRLLEEEIQRLKDEDLLINEYEINILSALLKQAKILVNAQN